jgi:hypothetical protein
MSLSKKGENKAGKPPQMPFLSMKPILNLLPVVDPDNAPQQDWHWNSASPAFKQGIIDNLKASIQGTIASAADAIKNTVQQAASSALQQAMAGLGKVGQWLAQHLQALVQWIVDKIPPIPPEVLLNSLML